MIENAVVRGKFVRSLMVCGMWACALAPCMHAEENAKAPAEFPAEIGPLLKKYCYDCHAGKEPEGKLSLDELNPAGGRAVRASWQKVRDNLHTMLMPPTDSPQPTTQERAKIIAWLNRVPLYIDCSGGAFPGRVTIRRLNRVEYNNTVRDLCGVKIQPAQDFPSDDIGYGFDNIGDVLSLPPLLLEKYLDAADRVAKEAILVFDPSAAPVKRGDGGDLNSNGEIALEYDFPRDGDYLLRASAWAEFAE